MFLPKQVLVRNFSNSFYIFFIGCEFKNLTIGLYVLIISFMLANFQENQRPITMSSIECLISSFCDLKLCIKYKFIDRIVNNILFKKKKNEMCVKNIKNM